MEGSVFLNPVLVMNLKVLPTECRHEIDIFLLSRYSPFGCMAEGGFGYG
jgi:hypothetical protein